MAGVAWSLITLVLGGAFAATAAVQEGPAAAFVVIASGGNSAIHEPAQMVVRDRTAWLALWSRHAGTSAAVMPAVDFSRHMVVAVFGGTSRVPRTAIVQRIVQEPGRLVVWYAVRDAKPPLDGNGLTPAAPYVMVRLARSTLPVTFAVAKMPQVYAPPP